MSVVDKLKDDFASFLQQHSAEISDALELAGKVAGNPLAQTALSLVHVPAGTLQAVADMLARAETDFAAAAPPAPPAAEPPAVPEPAPEPAEPGSPPVVVPAAANVMP